MYRKAWEWLKQYHKTILIFLFVLGLGAGIQPTIESGKDFVAALQFAKMVEVSPVYAVVHDVESQTGYYVLSLEEKEGMVVLWILPSEGEDYASISTDLYAMFISLGKHYYSGETYIIVEAEEIEIPSMNGYIVGFKGIGFFSMTTIGVEIFAAVGIENADSTLKALHGEGFDARPLEWESVYMVTLLARAPGHVPPWSE